MATNITVSAGHAGQFLLAGGGTAPGPVGGRGLAVATLVTWLSAELLGAYMLRNWIASGGFRDRQARPPGLSPALIFWHAGLAFGGVVSWVSFLVTVWTPYPARRPRAGPDPPGRPGPGQPGDSTPAILVTNEVLDRALANEALTGKLVDDLLERMLTEPARPPRNRAWQFAPMIPVLHGVLAIATFLLAMLAAVAALPSA